MIFTRCAVGTFRPEIDKDDLAYRFRLSTVSNSAVVQGLEARGVSAAGIVAQHPTQGTEPFLAE